MSSNVLQYNTLDKHIEHNYNTLLSWYLTNLKNGEFEQLTHNKQRSKQLEIFLNTQFQDFGYDSEKVFLVISLPSMISPEISARILPDLLLKVFSHIEGTKPPKISITSIGQNSITNEQLYIVRNISDNFETKSQLSFGVNSRHGGTAGENNNNINNNGSNSSNNVELNSIISGESGFSLCSTNSSIPSSHVMENKIFHSVPSIDIDQIEDTAQPRNSDVDNLSIDSYNPEYEQSIGSENNLTRVSTNEESVIEQPPMVKIQSVKSDYDNSPSQNLNHSQSVSTHTVNQTDKQSFISDTNSQFSQDTSFLGGNFLKQYPSIVTTNTSIGTSIQYNLILDSMLFINVDDGLITTAIKQSTDNSTLNQSAYDEDYDDDEEEWLLYDENFSLDNLQLLNFDEVIESTPHTEKVLFYSLVSTRIRPNSEDELDIDDEYDENNANDNSNSTNNDLTVMEFNGRDTIAYDGEQIRYIDTNNTSVASPNDLSKQTTNRSSRTNFGSIKSELNLIYKADTILSHIQRSKSTPVTLGNKLKKTISSRTSDHRTCIIM